MYELTDVTKRYRKGASGVLALDGVNLTIPDGEFLAIRGQTGSGKSTLLQLLGGLDRPTNGTAWYGGQELRMLTERDLTALRAKEFGFVFQSFNLIPTLSAQENVETALVPLGVSASERRERARVALQEVGLADRTGHLPGELSGGEQQRTAIARALVKGPRVILADEPTGNLDERTRDEIVTLLVDLWNARGVTLVIVTHDAAVAERAHMHTQLVQGHIQMDLPTEVI